MRTGKLVEITTELMRRFDTDPLFRMEVDETLDDLKRVGFLDYAHVPLSDDRLREVGWTAAKVAIGWMMILADTEPDEDVWN